MGFKIAELYAEIKGRDAEFRKKMKGVQRICLNTQKHFEALARKAKWAFLALAGAATLAIRAYAKQEEAERVLAQALRDTGQAAGGTLDRMKKLASAIQKVTVYGDEEVLTAMTLATNYGVLADGMEKLLQQAIGVSQFRGGQVKLADAIRYAVFASKGLFGELSQAMPVLMTVNTATEKMALFNELAARGWNQAQEAAKTAAGTFTQLKNLLSDLAEALGEALLPAITKLVVDLKELIPRMIQWVKVKKATIASFAKLTAGVLAFLILAPQIIAAIRGMAMAFTFLTAAGGPIMGLIGLFVGAGGLVYAIRSGQLAWRKFREEVNKPIKSTFADEVEAMARNETIAGLERQRTHWEGQRNYYKFRMEEERKRMDEAKAMMAENERIGHTAWGGFPGVYLDEIAKAERAFMEAAQKRAEAHDKMRMADEAGRRQQELAVEAYKGRGRTPTLKEPKAAEQTFRFAGLEQFVKSIQAAITPDNTAKRHLDVAKRTLSVAEHIRKNTATAHAITR